MGNFLSHVKNKKRNKKKKPIKIATFVTKATLLFFEQSLSNFFRNCGKLVESSKLYTCPRSFYSNIAFFVDYL